VSVMQTKARLLRDYHQVDCHSSSAQTNIIRREDLKQPCFKQHQGIHSAAAWVLSKLFR